MRDTARGSGQTPAMDPLTDVVLETGRLRLRAFEPGDADDVGAACADPLIQRRLPLPSPYTEQDAHAWVTEGAHADRLAGCGLQRAVTPVTGGRLVGSVGLVRIDWRHGSGEVGYWVAPWARGRGYAAEAVGSLARWALGTLGLARVELRAAPDNVASQRVALRAGFVREGVQRSAGRTGTGRTDLVCFSLLPTDIGPPHRLLPDVTELSDGVVTLRPVGPGDAAALYLERSDPESERWVAPPSPYTREEAARQAATAAADWLAGEQARFAVVETVTGQVAGSITLRMDDASLGIGEIGYGLAAAYRGRGLMRRTLHLLAVWAFDEVGLARLEVGVGAGNAASLRTAERAGFRRECVLRHALPGPEGRYDMVLLSLLPRDLDHGTGGPRVRGSSPWERTRA